MTLQSHNIAVGEAINIDVDELPESDNGIVTVWTSGSLPPGLAVNEHGQLIGTVGTGATGNYDVTIVRTQNFRLSVAP
jgi:hypothetical protein